MYEDKQTMIDAYSNNTFSFEALEKTLNELKQNSFSQLYGAQLALSAIRRFDFKMSDLTLSNILNKSLSYYPRKYITFIDENFIAQQNRLEYKKSKFYNKELSLFDVASNPHIFGNTFMVFVDGKLFDTINILCKEDKTYLIFDINDGKNTTGIPKDYFDQLMNANVDITAFFVPNCTYGIYNTNRNVLSKYVDNLALSRFNLANNLDTSDKYLTFINTNELLFESVITDTTNSAEMLQFYDNSLRNFSNKYVHLNIFGLRHLLDQIDVQAGEKYIQIPMQDMPVPAENVMIFEDVDGKKRFAHNIKLKMYYPNIYEIIGNDAGNPLTIYAFYSDDTETVILKHSNELALYYKFTSNVLDKYKDNTIPDIIKNYRPMEVKYDIKTFQSSAFYPDQLKYKIETMKDLSSKDSAIVKSFIYNQMKENNGFYLDVSKIDLTKRLRTTNTAEISNPAYQETFADPRYVFIFKNDMTSEPRQMRFFIDGNLWVPDKAYKGNNYDYYYVPASMVKPDSYIEIERYDEYFFEKDVIFNTIDDKVPISFKENLLDISANDVFMTTALEKNYISRQAYKFTKLMGNDLVDISPDSFTTLQDFTVSPTNSDLLGIPLKLYVKKRCYSRQWNIETQEDVNGYLKFKLESNNNKDYFRIFRNGSILPTDLYNIDFGDSMTNEFTVALDMIKLIGDKYVVECTPNKYKQIDFRKSIPPSGFVDFKGVIDKPFDLKYYDLFLNGVKVTKKNIEVLSPTKILISGIPTTKNLVLLQKNRDEELIPVTPSATSIADTLFDSLPELRNSILSSTDDIIDTMPDIVTDILSAVGQDMLVFFDMYSKNTYFNADESSIADSMVARFPSLFMENNVMFINPDAAPDATTIMVFKPELP